MNTVFVRYGHSVHKKQYTKNPNAKYAVKADRDIDENKIVRWHDETFGIFRPLVAEWRWILFVYDVIGNMAIATSIDRGQRRFEPSQETGVKKMINGNVSSEFISLWLRVCKELQVLSNPASRLWFYAYKKYKNGNSVKLTALQRRIRSAICSGGSDNFSSGISWKLPKIATSNVIFSRTFDRIATKFCMTI